MTIADPSGPVRPGTDSSVGTPRGKHKTRAVWISFVSRIVAQLVGATATITLGMYVVQQGAGGGAAAEKRVRPLVTRATTAGVSRSIVVLPLADYSAQKDSSALADGLTEAIIARLAQQPELHVLSRTSAMAYKGSAQPLPVIASELAVDLVVEASITRVDDRVRLTAQLIVASTDEHLWARTYDERGTDLLTLEQALSEAVARDIANALDPPAARQAD